MLSAFYPVAEKSKASKAGDAAPQEEQPSDQAADLDNDDESEPTENMASHTDVPMVFEDGTHLTSADLAQVDVAEREFSKKARTLAAEADREAHKYGIYCTDRQRKIAARIMDIVGPYSAAIKYFI